MNTPMLQQYQDDTLTFAVYPMQNAIEYTALGFAGEVGELDNKLKKVIRDGGGVITPEKAEMLCDELGDCMWYIARHSADLGFKLQDDLSVQFSPTGANYNSIRNPVQLMLALTRVAGKIAANSENYLANGRYGEFERGESDGLLCEAIQICRGLAYELNSDLEKVCQANIAKLQGRKERQTLQGDGDNR